MQHLSQVRRTQFGGSTRARDLCGELDLDASALGHQITLAMLASRAGNGGTS
jgi:hypothetical protein